MVWSLYIRGWEFSIIWITISIFLQLGDMSLVGVDTSFGAIFALATVVIFATAPFALVFLINYKFSCPYVRLKNFPQLFIIFQIKPKWTNY